MSHGCLRVALQGDRLMAEGPVASSSFASLQADQTKGETNSVRFDPSSAYLELNSVALQPLLGSVFNNPLIAEQLNSRSGLSQELRVVLLAAPVVFRVDSLEACHLQASIQARSMLAADQTDWIKRSLDAVANALLKRGFQLKQRPLLSPDGRPSNRVAGVWLDSQGHHQSGGS